MKEGRLTPRIADTAKAFYNIYLAISVACASAITLQEWTGTTHYAHLYHGVSGRLLQPRCRLCLLAGKSVDWVCVVFLLIGGINFSMHFIAWRKLSLKVYLKDVETCGWIGTAALISIFASFMLVYSKTYTNVYDAIYYGVTNTVFVISTGGFANTNYGEWPLVVQLMILFGSCFATCAGSTGGGFKMIRAIALVKQGNLEFKRILHPRMVRL